MNREYHKVFSPALNRDMEMIVLGHGGAPLIVFPTSMGRFYDYENRNMHRVIAHKYEAGEIQAFCLDSVDAESWYNKAVHPRQRAERHVQYDRYLMQEVIPYVQQRTGEARVTVTGCSFGGYHSVNFAMRHPELCDACVSLGGAFDIQQFLNGYYDDNCYFNCPPDFLPALDDVAVLNEIRRMKIVLATGETDICLAENHRLSHILNEKQIPHYLDVWGNGTGHDWQWWEQMTVKFFG